MRSLYRLPVSLPISSSANAVLLNGSGVLWWLSVNNVFSILSVSIIQQWGPEFTALPLKNAATVAPLSEDNYFATLKDNTAVVLLLQRDVSHFITSPQRQPTTCKQCYCFSMWHPCVLHSVIYVSNEKLHS